MVEESSSSGYVSVAEVNFNWQEIMLISQRSHAVLYKARRNGRWFILKTLPSSLSQNTADLLVQQREFQFGFLLQHPNIAETYALEDVPGVGLCIVEEYVDGYCLDEWLANKPSFTYRKRVWEQLQDVMTYLHARQITHNDLKAANIMVTHNGQNVKLIDFGLGNSDDTAFLKNTNNEDDIRLKRICKILFKTPFSRFYLQHPKAVRLIFGLILFLFFVATLSVSYWLLHQARLEHQVAEETAQIAVQKAEAEHYAAEEAARLARAERQAVVNEVKYTQEELQAAKEFQQEKIKKKEILELVRSECARCERMACKSIGQSTSQVDLANRMRVISNYDLGVRDSIANLYGYDGVLRQFSIDAWNAEFQRSWSIVTECMHRRINILKD